MHASDEPTWVTNEEGEISEVLETDAVFKIRFRMAVASTSAGSVGLQLVSVNRPRGVSEKTLGRVDKVRILANYAN